jgi:hypothetical protein
MEQEAAEPTVTVADAVLEPVTVEYRALAVKLARVIGVSGMPGKLNEVEVRALCSSAPLEMDTNAEVSEM